MENEDYKSLIEGFVKGLNILIKDPICCYDYKGGEFVLDCKEDGVPFISLIFKEGDEELVISKTEMESHHADKNSFYEAAHMRILRTVFFAGDMIGGLLDPETNEVINTLSFDTLSRSGLDKIREWKKEGSQIK